MDSSTPICIRAISSSTRKDASSLWILESWAGWGAKSAGSWLKSSTASSAATKAVEDFSQEPALFAPQPAHDSKIHSDDASFLVDEEIALMHIGVEESIAQGGAQKCLNQSAGKGLRIKPKRDQTVGVGQGHAVDPFHRHHFAGGAIPLHRRRSNVWIIL